MTNTLTIAREAAVREIKAQGYTDQQAAFMALIWYPIPARTPKKGKKA